MIIQIYLDYIIRSTIQLQRFSRERELTNFDSLAHNQTLIEQSYTLLCDLIELLCGLLTKHHESNIVASSLGFPFSHSTAS